MTKQLPIHLRRAIRPGLLICLWFCMTLMLTQAEVKISEFVASNATGLVDEDGDTSDWIEFYNGGSTALDLGGWFLTDDLLNLARWQFPSTSLLPGHYLLVFASGKDRKSGELHTNFKLPKAGGDLGLVRPDGTTVEDIYENFPVQHDDLAYGREGEETSRTLVGQESEVRYEDPVTGTPGQDWITTGYDDSSWLAGENGIGYSREGLNYDSLVQTPLTETWSGILARFQFEAPALDRLNALSLDINYDDGFAAFLNGVQIASKNAPGSLMIDSQATATHSGAQALQTETLDVSSSQYLLRAPLPEGVIASWDPVSITDDVIKDATGKHDGTLHGPTVVMDAERGPVMSMNGNDLVVVPNHEEFNLADFTISAWVHVTEGQNHSNRLVSMDNVTDSIRRIFALRTAQSNGGKPSFQITAVDPAMTMIAEAREPLTTGWHHLVGVRETAKNLSIYVDGVLQGQVRDYLESRIFNDAPISIGGYYYNETQGEYFRGLVDEVRLYNRAVSPDEIARTYAARGVRHHQIDPANVLGIQTLNRDTGDAGMLLHAELRSSVSALKPIPVPAYLEPSPYYGNGSGLPGVAALPQLSHPDGVYESGFVVTPSDTIAGAVIRYTLDGTQPDESSAILNESLPVNPPAILRVRQFVPGIWPSPDVTYHYLDAPVYINEFLAINTSVNPDNVDLGDFSDWIELRNPASHQVALSGFGMTDDALDPFKWRFPEGTVIEAGATLLVWADGNDAAPGDLVQRDYSPYQRDRLERIHADFKLSGDGEAILLYTPGGTLLDQVEFGPQTRDVSVGRAIGSGNVWLQFGEPTPGFANTTAGIVAGGVAPDVGFSISSGILAAPAQLALAVDDSEAEIRYTTDSSRPTSQSPLYSEPLVIDQSSVVRARSFKAGQLPGKEGVEVYLFDSNSTLPIVSLAAYPDTLFDSEVGIFANNFKKRDMPVHIDFYEPDGEGEFHIDAGMRLIGWVIQSLPQKPISISLDDQWGVEELSYPIFPDREYQKFDEFVLRPGGQDGDSTFLREGLVNTVLQGQMDVDHQAYRPARLYLNGVYHGLYNIREKQNLSYLRANHPGVGGAEIDFLEHDVAPAVLSDGDAADYEELIEFMETNDLAVAENYDWVASQIDINEFINFQIASIYIGRRTPDHNIKFWKTKPSGRWRWLVFDVDQMWTRAITAFDTLSYITSPAGNRRAPLWATIELRSLLKNPSFRDEFIQRFATHIRTTFSPERVHPILDQLKAVIEPEMPLQIARWPTRIASLETWEINVAELRTFADDRPNFQMGHLKNKFGLADTSTLIVHSNETHGSVLAHGVKLPSPFVGEYFDDIPVKLEAVPAVGYRFAGWSHGVADRSIEVLPNGGFEVSANFELDSSSQFLPSVIDSDFTVSSGVSPWLATGDVFVSKGAKLTLEAGSKILMPDRANLYVEGSIEVKGTAADPVAISPNPMAGARHPLFPANDPTKQEGRDHRWGAVVLDHPDQPVVLQHLMLSGNSYEASDSPYYAGLTAIETDLTMENLHVDDARQPFLVLGGSVVMRDSFIHTTSTGDGINVKGAQFALIERCEFLGGESPDTDAIDYDQVSVGMIRENQIHGFFGFNSDGIDLGEGSTGITIEGNTIYDCSDKGISVGQASIAILKNNTIFGCTQGVGVKDTGSVATIDHCTFFDNVIAAAAFEKNLGSGGGTVHVTNSILSFSQDAALFTDEFGTATSDYCLANTESLPGIGNLYDGPDFVSPFLHDFRLQAKSSAIDSGDPAADLDLDGSRADIGAIPYQPLSDEISATTVVITEIHFNPSSAQGPDDDFEFIEIYNPNSNPVQLGGYSFTAGIAFTFPPGSVLAPHQYALVAKNSLTYEGNGYSVYQWTSGKLNNGGEVVVLVDPDGYAVDLVQFGTDQLWPMEPDGGGPSLIVGDSGLANASAWNWRSSMEIGGTPGTANWSPTGTLRPLPDPGMMELTWETVPGIAYQLEHRLSLTSGDWAPVGDSVMATDGQTVMFHDAEDDMRGFYRVRLLFR